MKKGFTLIELLAVIVILAIIALIAVPTITGLVERARKGGVQESANGYNDAINKQMALNQMDSNNENDINKGIYDAPFDSKYNLKVKGQTPTKGWVEVLKDGVYRYSLVIGEYVVSYDGDKVTVVKGTDANSKPSFATDSWKAIIANVKSGKSEVYNLGDTKEIDMGDLGKHTVRIANMSTPSECSNADYSQTACGFVLEFADCIIGHKMNNTGTNAGGWPATSMRDYVNNDIYNSFPSDLKSGIIDTKVVSGHGKNDNTNFTSTDKLYLLSTKEVWGNVDTTNELKYDSINENTRQLDYYSYKGVTTSESNSSAASKNSDWWLRSVHSWTDYSFFYVHVNGYLVPNSYKWASSVDGVSPAFRIG